MPLETIATFFVIVFVLVSSFAGLVELAVLAGLCLSVHR
jgi:hypothetical protein